LGGKVPIAEIWVRRLISSGIMNVSMNLCVMAEAIKRHFANGEKFGVNLTFAEEGVPSGTLGGVCKMALGHEARVLGPDNGAEPIPSFSGSTIIVPSGDIVANFGADLLDEMYDIHRRSGAAMTMVVTQIPPSRRKDFGTVVMAAPEKRVGAISRAGRISEFREKDPASPSCLNNASIYVIEMDLLKAVDALRTEAKLGLSEPFYDFGQHLFPAMLGQLPYSRLPKDYDLWGVQFDGPWFDVGNKRDYLSVNRAVLDGIINIPLTYERLPWGYLGTNVEINFSGVEIRSPVVIGNDCIIEPGAVLGPYAVIGDGWRIENGVEITNSVLWERYPYYLEGRERISAKHRRLVDRHEVRRGVRVAESIIAGGCISEDTVERTVDVREDGHMAVMPIDYVPAEPRA
jgi:mannose-1-phosphate guanylyltransferase/phosphomannomutase